MVLFCYWEEIIGLEFPHWSDNPTQKLKLLVGGPNLVYLLSSPMWELITLFLTNAETRPCFMFHLHL